MIISIHPDRIGKQSYSERWAEFLHRRKAKVNFVNLYENDALEQVCYSDGVMWRWDLKFPSRIVAPMILEIIEKRLNIPVYPDYPMRWPWDDKIKQYYLFNIHKIKSPRTWIFWNKEEAFDWIDKTEFPKVFKLKSGASSANVVLVETKKEAFRLAKTMFSEGIFSADNLDDIKLERKLKPILRRIKLNLFNKEKFKEKVERRFLEKGYVYFQELLNIDDGTYRVAIIGDRAFSYYRFHAKNDFRADTIGRNYSTDPGLIPVELVKIAFDYSDKLNVTCAGFDFLKSNDDFFLTEICWTFPDYKIHECPGHWDRSLKWYEGHIWPEEAQVEDFLERINQASYKK